MGSSELKDERTIHVDLGVGETLTIGGARVRLEHKSGRRARLVIVAPTAMRVTPPTRLPGIELARRGVKG